MLRPRMAQVIVWGHKEQSGCDPPSVPSYCLQQWERTLWCTTCWHSLTSYFCLTSENFQNTLQSFSFNILDSIILCLDQISSIRPPLYRFPSPLVQGPQDGRLKICRLQVLFVLWWTNSCYRQVMCGWMLYGCLICLSCILIQKLKDPRLKLHLLAQSMRYLFDILSASGSAINEGLLDLAGALW